MQLDKNMTEKCQTSSEELDPDKWGQSVGLHGGGPILWRLGGRSRRSESQSWWCGTFATLVHARLVCRRRHSCQGTAFAHTRIHGSWQHLDVFVQ
eukprot:11299317-Ditylum_brightwellii.AAC.1